ncbi:MAG TPA: shikimate kinase [Verrucomicrobiae bacterium]|nr:shikimate kinase [Verrucomicrobiae bacterium]
MNVILIGMKHCGKTTLGSALAARWGCPFYDIDRMIEEYNSSETGQQLTVREIFTTGGEGRFRELEAKAVCDLFLRLDKSDGSNVVAVGGRTALNKKVEALLSAMGLVVYLDVSPDEMFTRVTRSGLPPFVDENDPENHFLQLHKERAPYYQRLARLTVKLDGLDADAALEKLCRGIEEYGRTRNTGR